MSSFCAWRNSSQLTTSKPSAPGVDYSRTGTPVSRLLLSPSSTASSMLPRVLLVCTADGPRNSATSIGALWSAPALVASLVTNCGTLDLTACSASRGPPTRSDAACGALPGKYFWRIFDISVLTLQVLWHFHILFQKLAFHQ